MNSAWKEFFAFLARFSPLWVTIMLVGMILAYRSPDIIRATALNKLKRNQIDQSVAEETRLVADQRVAPDRTSESTGGVGRELVVAAVLEFIDRLHQADIAFLDQIEELQAAVGVFLGVLKQVQS